MGSIHCFTTHRRQRAGQLTASAVKSSNDLPVREGVVRDFRAAMHRPCTDAEVVRWSASAVIQYLMEVLSAQKLDVPPKAKFKFFGVYHDGWYQLLVKVSEVIDLATGKVSARCFVASPLDLYPKPVCKDSEIVKNTNGKSLITLPMSTLYRYTV